jgi:anti-sigma-K factor RskA
MSTDDMLMAYVDGELSAEDRARVEAEMHADPGVARRVEQHRALRNNLRNAFDGVLREPVPERLVAAARGTGAAPVADFAAASARARESRQASAERAKRRWSWPEWGAMAASLLIGVIVTRAALHSPDAAPFTSQGGQLVAQGALANALSNQLASTQPRDAAAQVGVSFRAKSGQYCRSFTMRSGDALAGLACREDDAWRIDVLARGDSASGDYQQASSALPPAVLSAVEQQIEGEPLDAASESRARQSNWQRAAAP